MLRKITLFMLELVLILVLGVMAIGLVVGVVQALIAGSIGFVVGLAAGLYIWAMHFVLTNLGYVLGGTFLTFSGYITYRVLTDED